MKKIIRKLVIKYHRFLNKPILLVQDDKIWTQYNKRSFTISFDRNVYIDCLLTTINQMIDISGQKPTVIKVQGGK